MCSKKHTVLIIVSIKSLFFTLIGILLLMAMPIFCFAQLGDLDLETKRYISAIASDTSEAQTYGGTVILPVQLINGGAAVSWVRTSITTDGAEDTEGAETQETHVSDDLQYRIQGGPVYKGVSLQFFIEGDWGKHIDRGGFIRPGSVDIQGWHLSGGVGTYLRGLQEELRLDADEPETLLKPLAFFSLTRKVGNGAFSVLTTWSPTFDFEVHDLLLEPQFTAEVNENVNLTLTGRFGQQHEMTVREYIAQIDVGF